MNEILIQIPRGLVDRLRLELLLKLPSHECDSLLAKLREKGAR